MFSTAELKAAWSWPKGVHTEYWYRPNDDMADSGRSHADGREKGGETHSDEIKLKCG